MYTNRRATCCAPQHIHKVCSIKKLLVRAARAALGVLAKMPQNNFESVLKEYI